MFPSSPSLPPAQFGIPLPPAPSSPPPPPLFGAATLPSSGDARPENEELLRQVVARFECFADHALHVLNLSRLTVRWHRDAMRNYLKFLRMGLGLDREDFQRRIYDIDAWVRWNLHDRKLSAISMHNYWRAVKLFWNDVATRDGVQHPFAGKRPPAKPQRVPKAHTPDECRRILAATENYPWESPFHLAGLRKSELLALEVRDVDVNAGTLRVRHGKGCGGGKERVAYMPDELRRLLTAYNTARAAAHLVCPEYFASLKYRRGIKQDT